MDIQAYLDAFQSGDLTADGFAILLGRLVENESVNPDAIVSQLESSYRAEQVPLDVFVTLVDTVRRTTTRRTKAARDQTDADGGTVLRSRGGRVPPAVRRSATGGRSQPSLPTASGPTGTDWNDRTQVNATGPLQPGVEVKGRFVLEKVLGVGGMGIVYKARDKVRVEARDRNPYVALKVLNGDFQQHPDSFIALQRESSRTQRLAHPNIATVYDFDRTEDTVYMTMELLEGVPLDAYIKLRAREGGMLFKDAYPIICGLGNALAYAHGQGIVHSDFKPGNAFVTKDGAVKVLDFGIARAVKRPGQADTTLFDGSDLGALTPAYASPEMHEGLDSDPRDDIYALACVACELLTGEHPFDHTPANTARAKNMTPKPVPGLSRRQLKGLLRGLDFRRTHRTPTVEQFLAEIKGETSSRWRTWAIVSVIGVAAVVFAALWVYDHYQDREQTAMLTQFTSGDDADRDRMLRGLAHLDPKVRARFTQEARAEVLGYVQRRVRERTDSGQGHYDFPAAEALLRSAREWYPDSARLQSFQSELAGRKRRLLGQLQDSFDEHLRRGRLLPREGAADITDVLDLVRQIDPGNPMTHDPRLLSAYQSQAEAALKAGHRDEAVALVQAGLTYAGQDSQLLALRDELGGGAGPAPGDARSVRARLTAALPEIRSLADFDGIKADFGRLSTYEPGAAVLNDISRRLETLADERLQQLMAANDPAAARKLLAQYADYVSPLYLEVRREQIAAGFQGPFKPGPDRERQAAINAARERLAALMAKPTPDDRTWEERTRAALDDLAAAVPADDPRLLEQREAVAALYLGQARQARDQDNFDAASKLLDQAEAISPRSRSLESEREALVRARLAQQAKDNAAKERQAREQAAAEKARAERAHAEAAREAAQKQAADKARRAQQQERREQARLARISEVKEAVLAQANSRQVSQAEASLAKLRSELPADDPFLVNTGPQAIATAYLGLSREKGLSKRYEEAVRLARAGLALVPEDPALTAAVRSYQASARSDELRAAIGKLEGADAVGALGQDLKAVQDLDAKSYEKALPALAGALASRIEAVGKDHPDQADAMLAAARKILPGNAGLDKVTIVHPLPPVVILARAEPDRSLSWTVRQYSDKLAHVMTDEVVAMAGGRKVTVYYVIDDATTRSAKYEGRTAAVSKGFCKKQHAGKVLLGIFTPIAGSGFLGGDFDASQIVYSVVDCATGKKTSSKYTINSNHADKFAYEVNMRKTFDEFMNSHAVHLDK